MRTIILICIPISLLAPNSSKIYFYPTPMPDELIKVINAEAANQGIDGMVAVGQVVLERAEWDLNKVSEVVFAKGQFSSTRSKHFIVTKNARRAAHLAYTGKRLIPGAYYFLNEKTASKAWKRKIRHKKIKRIKDHTFYRR